MGEQSHCFTIDGEILNLKMSTTLQKSCCSQCNGISQITYKIIATGHAYKHNFLHESISLVHYNATLKTGGVAIGMKIKQRCYPFQHSHLTFTILLALLVALLTIAVVSVCDTLLV